MPTLFITGASGFIGRHLLARLNPERYDHIYGLTRRESTKPKPVHQNNFTWLEGSLANSECYENCLDSSVIVVHLAATTGKASAGEYFSVNRDGTRHLLGAAVNVR